MVRLRSACIFSAALVALPFVPPWAPATPRHAGGRTSRSWRATTSRAATPAARATRKPRPTSPIGSRRPGSPRPARRATCSPSSSRRERSSRRSRAWRWCATARWNRSRSGRTPRSRCGSIRRRRSKPRWPSSATACPIPELKIDDLAGQDLRGKVAVYIVGSPASVPDALSAHAQSAAVRWAALERAGAIGTIVLQHPARIEPPWERASLARLQPAMSLADPALDDTAGQQVSIAFNPASAERLFAGAAHTFADMVALAGDRKPLPGFPLPGVLRATVTVETTKVTSDNVAGTLVGQRSRAARRVRRADRPPRSPRRRRRGRRRPRSTTARWTTRPASPRLIEIAATLAASPDEAEALGAVRRRHGRREGPARLALLRRPPHRADAGPSSPTSTWTCSCRCSR